MRSLKMEEFKRQLENLVPLDTLLNVLTYAALFAVGAFFILRQI
jgi:hypothetical protein